MPGSFSKSHMQQPNWVTQFSIRHVAKYRFFAINLRMIGLFAVLLSSVILIVWSVFNFGPNITLPLLAGAAGFVLTVILLIRLGLRRRVKWAVIDGSNVFYWDNDRPALQSVKLVVDSLVSDGFEPILWFDANIGYLVAGRYLGPAKLSKTLGFPARRIFVAPKGTPADPLLIADAVKLNASIVTNDRFRDWQKDFPQITDQQAFLRGEINDKAVRFR